LSLKEGDVNTIIATLSTPLAGGETVLISYLAGTVTSVQGGWLASFTDQTVSLLAQTITFLQELNRLFSDSPFTLTASATGGPVTYFSSNMGVATASGNILTFHALGSSDITVFQAGNATYAPARYTRTLAVSIGVQTITFGPIAPRNVGDADFIPGAVASSGLTVSYFSSNSAVATIISGMIHIVGAGTSVITASQAGNTLFNAAPDVQQTLTVADATAKILELTSVLLQGLYSGSGTMKQAWNESGPQYSSGVADLIAVELHSAAIYSTIIYTITDVPLSITGTATVSIPAVYDESYYITIKHRNSIETTSATAISFSGGSSFSQSFGTPADVFGGNLNASFDSYFLIYGGDVDQDGFIVASDMAMVDNQSAEFGMGYIVEDVDGDGFVGASDMAIIDNNSASFIFAIIPYP
jgi:hypothetical protein